MPFNDASKNAMLDALSAITHIGIHQLSTEPGTGTNANSGEATGGGYARQSVTWGSAASGAKSNTNTLTFDVAAGSYGWLTMWNASSGNSGNYRGHMPINGTVKGFFSVDTTLTNDQLLSVSHGLVNDDRVLLFNVFSESLPTGTGLTEGAVLWVVSSATNTFKVALTQGGSAIDITATGGGEGYFQKIIPETFGAPGQITVAASALTLDLTGI